MSRKKKALRALNRQNRHAQRGRVGNHTMEAESNSEPPSSLAAGGNMVPSRHVTFVNFGSVINWGNVTLYDEGALPHRRTTRPVVGWRAWRLRKDEDGEPVLVSMVQDEEWGGPVKRADRKPGVNDNHGVHSFRLTRLNNEYDGAMVEGEVQLFGKVIVFEHGIRAEAATIRRLVVYPGGWTDDQNPPAPPGHAWFNSYVHFSALAQWYTPWAAQKASVTENRALIESLSRRYDCDVTFVPKVTTEDLGAGDHAPILPPVHERLVVEPTPEQVKWISGNR